VSRKRTSCAAHRARSASLFVDSCRAGSGRPRSCSSGAASERESPITSLAMRSQSAKKPAVLGRGDEPDRVHRLAAAVGTRSQGSSAATPPASSPGSADTQPAVTPLTRGSRSAEDEPSADRGAPRRATVRDFLPKFTKCADTEESAGYGLSACPVSYGSAASGDTTETLSHRYDVSYMGWWGTRHAPIPGSCRP
jgi:hypothetical protein